MEPFSRIFLVRARVSTPQMAGTLFSFNQAPSEEFAKKWL
jgi:hypothetical protein